MISKRLALYEELASIRGRPLIVYVTSNRANASGNIAGDMVPEFLRQLDALPTDVDALDLLVVSNGGDPTVAWRLVTLIREKVKRFAVLVPQAAYSAATLIALGADEIIMHPHGNLGPTDPQISRRRPQKNGSSADAISFSSEDLAAYLKFIKEDVGLTDQRQLLEAFNQFSDEVGAVAIATAARSGQLMLNMGQKLLELHLRTDNERNQARTISENLTKNYFHHGYPVSRTEASLLGLPVAERSSEIEQIMWDVWLNICEELQVRCPFDPVTVLRNKEECSLLFEPIPQIALPDGLPQELQAAVLQQAIQNINMDAIPAAEYENIHAVLESSRLATRYISRGRVYGSRGLGGQLNVTSVVERQGWFDCDLHKQKSGTASKKSAKRVRKKTKKKAVKKVGYSD